MGRLRPVGDEGRQLGGRVHARQSHDDGMAAAGPPVDERHPPAGRQRAKHVLEGVDGADGPAREGDDLVVIPQPAPPGIGRLQDVRHEDAAVGTR